MQRPPVSQPERDQATRVRDTLARMGALEIEASALEEFAGALRAFGSIAELYGEMPAGFEKVESDFGELATQLLALADRRLRPGQETWVATAAGPFVHIRTHEESPNVVAARPSLRTTHNLRVREATRVVWIPMLVPPLGLKIVAAASVPSKQPSQISQCMVRHDRPVLVLDPIEQANNLAAHNGGNLARSEFWENQLLERAAARALRSAIYERELAMAMAA